MLQIYDNIGTKVWKFVESIMNFVLRRTLHLKIDDKQWKELVQFVKFGIVGLSNTVISYVIYVGTLLLLQKNKMIPTVDYLVAQVIAFALSVLWSFYWNDKYVFQKEEHEERSLFHSLIRTYISYAFTGLFLNSIFSYLWVEVIHISKIIAPVINLVVSVPLNFLMNKFWAFRNK